MKRRSFIKLMGGAGAAVVAESAFGMSSRSPGRHASGMPMRVLGRTGFKVSIIPYGGLGLTHADQAQGTASVRRALDKGVNYLDVAPAYGNGDAEIKMGIALEGVKRDSYYLGCKTKKRDAAGAREELERSLIRLKTDYFDVYQLHHIVKPAEVEQAFGPNGVMEMVLQARKEGKIRAIGFSAHTTKGALQIMRGFKFDTVMFPINYVEYFTRDFGRDVLKLAEEQGAAVLSIKTMSAGTWAKDEKRNRQWWYKSLEAQEEINLAYRWTLSLPGVVMGYPPSWLDLQDKAIEAGIAWKPASAADAEQIKQMALNGGSLFKREEDSVALGTTPRAYYPDFPHERCPGSLA